MQVLQGQAERIEEPKKLEQILTGYLEELPHFLEKIDSLESYAQKVLKYGYVYILKAEEKTKGFIIFYANDLIEKKAYVSLIAVSKEFRRQNVGTGLLAICEEVSKENGMQGIRLEVDKDNFGGQKFYESLGFCIGKEIGEDSFYMEKVYRD